ncbi:hypothetical protein SISSUDRAFT_1066656 [Sistotremastrum suecicum HHB10207 ss-3]|uniref:F-box domain-containing protein n=1 Tax=Sistotremastrum suecicum HHB10207 ss-3 TaxID=1314776 RepID=A0A165Y1L5_9AGAM|nr:hypothetical protein SISSUDRAFT_1066656 [Sistotremastrum suecicum HHB10207 ss-3]
MTVSAFLALPVELVFLVIHGLSLKDLLNIAQTCCRFRTIAQTSRQFWYGAPDLEILPLPTGHTALDTIPAGRIILLALRAVKWDDAVERDEPLVPKRWFPYRNAADNRTAGDLALLPGNSWYTELPHGTPTILIKKAEDGWSAVSCEIKLEPDSVEISCLTAIALGAGFVNLLFVCAPSNKQETSFSVEIIKLYFADEELGPKAPSLVERSKVMVPWKPSALFADDAMLVAYEFRTGGLLVLNLCTNRGRILELNEEQKREITQCPSISFIKEARKVLIKPEIYVPFHPVYTIFGLPQNLFDEFSREYSGRLSEPMWTTQKMDDIMQFAPSDSLSPMPSALLGTAIHLTRFNYSTQKTEGRGDVSHYGYIYLYKGELFAFETHQDDQDFHAIQPPLYHGASNIFSLFQFIPSPDLEIYVNDPSRSRIRRLRFQIPRDIPGRIQVRVMGTNISHGRLFMLVFNGYVVENHSVDYVIQY